MTFFAVYKTNDSKDFVDADDSDADSDDDDVFVDHDNFQHDVDCVAVADDEEFEEFLELYVKQVHSSFCKSLCWWWWTTFLCAFWSYSVIFTTFPWQG